MTASMEPAMPYYIALTSYISFGVLFVFGHVRDAWRALLLASRAARGAGGGGGHGATPKGYAPLCKDYEDFYTRRMFYRIHDVFNRPISSSPDAWIDVVERTPDPAGPAGSLLMQTTHATRRCLNLGSYNYLGFAAADPYCTSRVLDTLEAYGPSTCSGRQDLGQTRVHEALEREVAAFVGKPAALVFGMGFATNSLTLPVLMRGKGTLVVSDALNHSSIVNGVRGSSAKVKVFRHNQPEHLERVLRAAIAEGQPRTHRPWSKILIVVEGIYSMEGEVCRLPEIVAIKKKYKAYLFLDEAHSIGAMGHTGRGVTEHTGVDPADVDVMMGTFTKSFGSCGGYIAGDVALIQYLKTTSPGMYATTMSTPSVQQTLAALHVIQGKDGTTRGAEKLQRLHDNSNFFRDSLRAMGCEVLGDTDSPVMPVMLYNPGKIPAFSRECLARHLAMVVVGFPATPLLLSRARVCISASHTREELEAALRVLEDVVDLLGLRYRPDQRRDRHRLASCGGAGKGYSNGHAAAASASAPEAVANGHGR